MRLGAGLATCLTSDIGCSLRISKTRFPQEINDEEPKDLHDRMLNRARARDVRLPIVSHTQQPRENRRPGNNRRIAEGAGGIPQHHQYEM